MTTEAYKGTETLKLKGKSSNFLLHYGIYTSIFAGEESFHLVVLQSVL